MTRQHKSYDRHPSYGVIGFSRISGGKTKLFGSSLDGHHSTIMVRICAAEIKHDLGRDWIHGDLTPIVEVQLSPAQFAEFLTSPNVGQGVPCTIRSVNGKNVEEPPSGFGEEHHRINQDFEKNVKEFASELKLAVRDAKAILAKQGTITKGDRAALAEIFDRVEREVSSNWPFYIKQFKESAGRIVSEKKAEVDAFITHGLQILGLKSLHTLSGAAELPSLPTGETEE